MATGGYEVVTEAVDWPRDYRPIDQPEFVLEHLKPSSELSKK